MNLDRTTPPAEPEGSAARRALAAVNLVDRVVTIFCRWIVLATGIALTVILTNLAVDATCAVLNPRVRLSA